MRYYNVKIKTISTVHRTVGILADSPKRAREKAVESWCWEKSSVDSEDVDSVDVGEVKLVKEPWLEKDEEPCVPAETVMCIDADGKSLIEISCRAGATLEEKRRCPGFEGYTDPPEEDEPCIWYGDVGYCKSRYVRRHIHDQIMIAVRKEQSLMRED